MGPEHLAQMRAVLAQATYMDPDVQTQCDMTLADGTTGQFRVDLRAIWEGEDRPAYSRVVGKLTALQDEV